MWKSRREASGIAGPRVPGIGCGDLAEETLETLKCGDRDEVTRLTVRVLAGSLQPWSLRNPRWPGNCSISGGPREQR